MQYPSIFRILGIVLMIFSLSMLPPILAAQYYDDGGSGIFVFCFFITCATGFALWIRFHKFRQQLKTRDGFLIVGLFWAVLCLFGAFPFYVTAHLLNDTGPHVLTNAVFESVSGLTTTGATILSGLDYLPHGLLFYRQELQFIGGLGIVVLAIAVLPILGVGGMQLYRSETPGPIKDNKLTPRITETIKSLGMLYLGLTITCTMAYWFAGMDFFDAICHAFSTISTGGFSTHDDSFMFFKSDLIDGLAIIFMMLAATNFALHFLAFRYTNVRFYLRDPEFQLFIGVITLISLLTIGVVAFIHPPASFSEATMKPLFTVVSFITTTGFFTTDYVSWPAPLMTLILLFTLIGACGGSTAGGAKMVRFLVLLKQSFCELKRLIHPRAIYNVKFGKQILSGKNVDAIWGFMAAYLTIAAILVLLLMTTGLDLTTSFSVIVATISNTGSAVGSVTHNHYTELSMFGKWICIFAMLAGRLEIFSLLILFTPAFWRE
jgi:trk system potassium uptake protein TrkH